MDMFKLFKMRGMVEELLVDYLFALVNTLDQSMAFII
jgi:hypothetical protein